MNVQTKILPALTPRQTQILAMIANGHTNKEIGLILGISTKTIECHRKAIMENTGCTKLALLVRYAVRAGLITA